MTIRTIPWLVLLALATAFAADTDHTVCSLPSGPEPAGSGPGSWKGLYVYADSCNSTMEGQCLLVSREMFEGALAHPQGYSKLKLNRTVMQISLPRGDSMTTFSFRRVVGSPAFGARLVWIKFLPSYIVAPQPVFTRLVSDRCGSILFVEPIPGG